MIIGTPLTSATRGHAPVGTASGCGAEAMGAAAR